MKQRIIRKGEVRGFRRAGLRRDAVTIACRFALTIPKFPGGDVVLYHPNTCKYVPTGTRIKLIGLIDPCGTFHKGLSPAHWNSMRVTAWWGEKRRAVARGGGSLISEYAIKDIESTRGVSIRAYVYRDGEKVSKGEEILWIPEDPARPGWTVTGNLNIGPWLIQGKVGDTIRGTCDYSMPRRPAYILAGAHALSGGDHNDEQNGAPCDLRWEEDVR